MSGVCLSSESFEDHCFGANERCYQDEQCCNGYNCDFGECQPDQFDGQLPEFITFTNSSMWWMIVSGQGIIGNNLRPGMLFKLSANGDCSALDRSPAGNAPNGHYATRAGSTYHESLYHSAYYLDVPLRIYATENLGNLLVCYAVNDYAIYRSTGLYIYVPGSGLTSTEIANLPQVTVTYTEGFSKLSANFFLVFLNN